MTSPPGNPALTEFIRSEIQNRGPQPFSWFMQQALYHPEHGYYSSGRAKIGRHGDYFTNVSVGPLFGQLMSLQFAQIWEAMNKPDPFFIVEQGAHDARFAADVFEFALTNHPEFFESIHYQVVEPFPVWQHRQIQTLEGRPLCRPIISSKVTWNHALAPFAGIHFSNELLDAMPIDIPGKRVGLVDDTLALVDSSDTNLPPNESQLQWIDSVADNLVRGVIIAIDYGFDHIEFDPMIQARSQHRKLDSPFESIGAADITARVNWTDLAERGLAHGLHLAGFTDQHHFLTGIISNWPHLVTDEKSSRALPTLLHPEMLGRAFQVLALSKGVDLTERPLVGFKFARDAPDLLNIRPAS